MVSWRWRCGRDSVISEVVAEHESVVFTSWGWCICGVLCPCAGRVGSMLAAVGSCCVVFYMMEIWDVVRSCAMPCCASDLRWLRKVVAVLLGWCQALWVSWLCNQQQHGMVVLVDDRGCSWGVKFAPVWGRCPCFLLLLLGDIWRSGDP